MEAISPLEAIWRYVGEDIVNHEALIENAIKKINIQLPDVCKGPLGIEQKIFVELEDQTQESLLEVAIRFRSKGWKVNCSPFWGAANKVTVVLNL